MKNKLMYGVGALLLAAFIISFTYPAEKLLEPAKLAEIIKDPKAPKPMIINVGPTPLIKGAKFVGAAEDPANKERLKTMVKDLPKSKDIVLYCGCCKLEDCWNIHEASKIMASMGFTNYKILNMPEDFTVDWHTKGYPME
jgi:rhodanese-related sulfurtransferase